MEIWDLEWGDGELTNQHPAQEMVQEMVLEIVWKMLLEMFQ